MQMDVGLDTGPMLYKKAIPITEEDTAGTLTEKVGKLGAEMLVEYLKDPTKYPPVVQPKKLLMPASWKRPKALLIGISRLRSSLTRFALLIRSPGHLSNTVRLT